MRWWNWRWSIRRKYRQILASSPALSFHQGGIIFNFWAPNKVFSFSREYGIGGLFSLSTTFRGQPTYRIRCAFFRFSRRFEWTRRWNWRWSFRRKYHQILARSPTFSFHRSGIIFNFWACNEIKIFAFNREYGISGLLSFSTAFRGKPMYHDVLFFGFLDALSGRDDETEGEAIAIAGSLRGRPGFLFVVVSLSLFSELVSGWDDGTKDKAPDESISGSLRGRPGFLFIEMALSSLVTRLPRLLRDLRGLGVEMESCAFFFFLNDNLFSWISMSSESCPVGE